MGQWVKNPPAVQETQETWVQSLGREGPLEEEKATHSRILAWRIHGQRSWWPAVHGLTKRWTRLGDEACMCGVEFCQGRLNQPSHAHCPVPTQFPGPLSPGSGASVTDVTNTSRLTEHRLSRAPSWKSALEIPQPSSCIIFISSFSTDRNLLYSGS